MKSATSLEGTDKTAERSLLFWASYWGDDELASLIYNARRRDSVKLRFGIESVLVPLAMLFNAFRGDEWSVKAKTGWCVP